MRVDSSRHSRFGARLPWRGLFLLVALVASTWLMPAASGAAPAATEADSLSALGPPLTAVSTKIADPNWLVAWLLKPSRLRPGTIMPDADFTPAEAQAVARYLYDESARKAGAPFAGGDGRAGEQLFVSRGCRGCHAIEPGQASVSPRVPNLSGIGLKARGEWLSDWLASPRTYHPDTAMPKLALTPDEIRHLTAFLLTRRAGGDAVAAGPRFDAGADAKAGRELVERYECGKCHALKGQPPPEPAFELAAGDGKETALHNGRLLVAYYNCNGCHQLDGRPSGIAAHLERKSMIPPTIEDEGARVQPSWLVDFLQRPATLRPWLEIRMPDFGLSAEKATALAAYFAALSDVAASDEAPPAVTPELTDRGLRRLAHYKCVQCHAGGAPPAGMSTDDLSIDLAMAKRRLRPSWVREFLAHPKKIAGTSTRMPTVFYTVEGAPKVDKPEDDIAAISAYLLHATEPPAAAVAKLQAEKQQEKPAEQVDWSRIQY